MIVGNKNLKDSEKDIVKDSNLPLASLSLIRGEGQEANHFYNKLQKLITALYMVTDIIDKEEPIRNKLRILGIEIISDIHSIPADVSNKISEIVSFLGIASAMNFVSEMNCAILRKEFFDLKASIQEQTNVKPTWLSDFFLQPQSEIVLDSGKYKGHTNISQGQQHRTRIGVQKGSTLMKALSDRTDSPSINNFEMLKKERRFNIINAIKSIGEDATIRDIYNHIKNIKDGSSPLSEKTLQRELMSMIKDGVLNKTGEKRWSRYSIKTQK